MIALRSATRHKMRENFWWAAGYNSLAFPIAAGVFYPSIGLVLRPEIAAIAMSGSSLIVALNALSLRRVRIEGLATKLETRRAPLPAEGRISESQAGIGEGGGIHGPEDPHASSTHTLNHRGNETPPKRP